MISAEPKMYMDCNFLAGKLYVVVKDSTKPDIVYVMRKLQAFTQSTITILFDIDELCMSQDPQPQKASRQCMFGIPPLTAPGMHTDYEVAIVDIEDYFLSALEGHSPYMYFSELSERTKEIKKQSFNVVQYEYLKQFMEYGYTETRTDNGYFYAPYIPITTITTNQTQQKDEDDDEDN